MTAVAYDFKGGLLAAERQLGVDYTQTLDWSGLSELEDVSDLEVAAASMLESEVFRTESTFDALGRPTTQTTPDGTVVRLSYNDAALLDGVSANVRGDASETPFVSNIDYDAKGRRTLIAYGNGTETSYAYDDITQRLTRLRTTDATRTFQDLAYTYDAVGNIVEIADAGQDDVYFNGAVVTATQRYEYDALYRLTHAEGREHAGQNAAQPTEFGASPSLHPQDGMAMRTYAEQYVYDVVGNILSMQHSAASGNWTRRYQYAANGNRLQANSAPGDAVGVYSHAYTHDAHGNMTAMPHLSAVTWNYADQMRSADLGGGGTAYFVYDGAGQRVRKVRENLSGTQTYERIYLGAYELYRERTSGALQLERETLHIADDGGRMCDLETRTVESGTPVSSPTTHHRYQYSNHLGSASLELTASAEVISYEEYHPYGTSAYRAVNSSIDVSVCRYRYTGKERDEETGLGYHGARYYACWLGRWTASDPIGLGDGVNRYAYVSGRPTVRHDATGTRAEDKVHSSGEGNPSWFALFAKQASVQHKKIEPRAPQKINVFITKSSRVKSDGRVDSALERTCQSAKDVELGNEPPVGFIPISANETKFFVLEVTDLRDAQQQLRRLKVQQDAMVDTLYIDSHGRRTQNTFRVGTTLVDDKKLGSRAAPGRDVVSFGAELDAGSKVVVLGCNVASNGEEGEDGRGDQFLQKLANRLSATVYANRSWTPGADVFGEERVQMMESAITASNSVEEYDDCPACFEGMGYWATASPVDSGDADPYQTKEINAIQLRRDGVFVIPEDDQHAKVKDKIDKLRAAAASN